MSKGLDVGTSFIVLSSYEGDNINLKILEMLFM